MDLYSQKAKSTPQKIVIIFLEIVFIVVSYWILFIESGLVFIEKIGISVSNNNIISRKIILLFSIIVFIRMTFMMLYLLKRKIPWEESFSVPMAFALYFVGFPLLVLNRTIPIDWIDYFAIIIFILGSSLNTISELQRHFWKKKPNNKGKLYTIGLFKYSMHINYFGDVLWVSAYAIITRNFYAIAIPILLLCLFVFWNIPILDKYLSTRYEGEFEEYEKKTKKLIPLIY